MLPLCPSTSVALLGTAVDKRCFLLPILVLPDTNPRVLLPLQSESLCHCFFCSRKSLLSSFKGRGASEEEKSRVKAGLDLLHEVSIFGAKRGTDVVIGVFTGVRVILRGDLPALPFFLLRKGSVHGSGCGIVNYSETCL